MEKVSLRALGRTRPGANNEEASLTSAFAQWDRNTSSPASAHIATESTDESTFTPHFLPLAASQMSHS